MSSSMSGRPWPEEYREVLTFYYWEPQHLRPRVPGIRGPGPTAMWEHVRRLEVATNHILNLYLSMVPFGVLNHGTGWAPDDEYVFPGSRWLREVQDSLGKFTQPDLYLFGTTRGLAIELKTGSKSTVEQVHKYLCFHELLNPGRPLTLLFLSPQESPDRLLTGRRPLDELPAAVAALPPPPRHPELTGRIPAAAARFDVRAMTFKDLDSRLADLAGAAATDLERRVHDGLRWWLREAELVPADRGKESGAAP